MAVMTDCDGARAAPCTTFSGKDPYIRIKDVLVLLRSHLPRKGVLLKNTPDSVDDCRVVTQGETYQFHFQGSELWTSYQEIEDWDRERRSSKSHTDPPPRSLSSRP